MKNITNLSHWNDYKVVISSNILSQISLEYALSKFWNDLIINIDPNKLILIQFKILDMNNNYKSISYLQKVSINEYDLLLKTFKEFLNIRSEHYQLTVVNSIIFTYKFISSSYQISPSSSSKSKIIQHISLSKESKINSFKFSGWNLNNNMDFTTWGRTVFINDYKAIVYKFNSDVIYHINLFDNYIQVKYTIGNRCIFSFTDTMRSKSDLSSFVRVIKNQEYIFENGQLIVKKILRKCKFLTKVNSEAFLDDKFITMDLETRTIKGQIIPYNVSIYDGQNSYSFYFSDYDNSDQMLTESVKFLMKRKYSGYKIYLHNFSNFDGIFLIRILSSLSDNINPIIRDNRIIDLKFKFENNYILYFRDSYLMLPSSLSKLAIQFNVDNKGIFPYNFINDKFNNNININYIGKVPEYKYFIGISKEQYNEYIKSFSVDNKWSLRNETINYCEQDCISLYQVIDKFSKHIFKLFRINIHKYPTLSSLAFAIYRAHFLKDAKIPLITDKMFYEFKKGYTGGAVDVYKPYGTNIFRYDVNSLYPYIMKNCLMPVGIPIYFEGDITLIENKPYGIFNVEVKAPLNLKEPILQIKHKSKTIAPVGEWTGTYFSGEIYNAMKYGYTFKITSGYLFETGNIFNDYVNNLYEIKQSHSKDEPMYLISKLLLNSLYGRFGMNPDMENYKIISSEDIMNYINNYTIVDILNLHNGKELISYINEDNNDNKLLNISIPIALIITASARIHMSQFKNNPNFNLYYSDTDSIDIDKPLPENFIGTELGKMKFEHKFKQIMFLAPKVYAGISNEYELVKIKGVKNPVTFDSLLPLLTKNNKLIINQDKWYKSISDGIINIKDEIYTLMVTENKRKLIYENNKFIDTKPLTINNNKIN